MGMCAMWLCPFKKGDLLHVFCTLGGILCCQCTCSLEGIAHENSTVFVLWCVWKLLPGGQSGFNYSILNANSAFCALLPLPSICSIHIFFIFVFFLSSDIFTSGRFLILQGPKILGEWISLYWENLKSTLLASKASGTSYNNFRAFNKWKVFASDVLGTSAFQSDLLFVPCTCYTSSSRPSSPLTLTAPSTVQVDTFLHSSTHQ